MKPPCLTTGCTRKGQRDRHGLCYRCASSTQRTGGTTYPIEPILRRVEKLGGFTAAVRADAQDVKALRRSYMRAKNLGTVSDLLADRLCVELLGMHPCEVYGEQWWQLDGEAPDSAPWADRRAS